MLDFASWVWEWARSARQELIKTPGAKLVHVVDVNADRAREVGERHSCKWSSNLRDAFKDDAIEAVLVMTPSGLHAESAVESLEAGKTTIVTKPLEVSLDRCDLILAAARKSGQKLGVDFQERYEVENQKIKRAAVDGVFGRLLLGEARLKMVSRSALLRSRRLARHVADGRRRSARESKPFTSSIFSAGSWVGRKASSAKTYTLNHKIETEDVGMAMLEFPSGAVGTILGTTTVPGGTYWGLEIHAPKAGVNAPMHAPHDWRFLENFAERGKQLKTLFPHRNIFEDVVSSLRKGTPLTCSGQDGRVAVEVLDAESIRRHVTAGAPVTLPDSAGGAAK